MRIDPSQLSEPLAHILGAGATDAADGQKASKAAKEIVDPQLETLDALLLRRLQANATAAAADSVVSFQDALARMERVRALATQDPAAAAQAQGTLDPSRVRGLLG